MLGTSISILDSKCIVFVLNLKQRICFISGYQCQLELTINCYRLIDSFIVETKMFSVLGSPCQNKACLFFLISVCNRSLSFYNIEIGSQRNTMIVTIWNHSPPVLRTLFASHKFSRILTVSIWHAWNRYDVEIDIGCRSRLKWWCNMSKLLKYHESHNQIGF